MASTLRFGLLLPRPTAPRFLNPSQLTAQTSSLAVASTASRTSIPPPLLLAATPLPPLTVTTTSPRTTTTTTTRRCFSTSPAALATGYPRQGIPRDSQGASLPLPKPHARDEHIPAYPYGPRRVYKQSNAGLYGSARIRFGNNVSEKWSVKTPRRWRPNIQRRRLWSPALQCFVQTRVTTRVLRTIDKCGGLDEYLLGDKAQRIKDLGPWGWKLRWRLMQSDAVRERFTNERKRLGLIPKTEAEIEAEMLAADEMVRAADDAQRQQMIVEMDQMLGAGEEFTLGPEEGRL